MEISIDRINKRRDQYQIFQDYIRDKQTRRRYRNLAYAFLKLIPDKIYSDVLGKIPNDIDTETLCRYFVELARKDPNVAYDVIAAFIQEDKKRVLAGEISSQTLPNHTKPIRALLDSNRIVLYWKSLNKMMPRRESKSMDRAYTRKEIQKMRDRTKDGQWYCMNCNMDL